MSIPDARDRAVVTLLLVGDVMVGRGIDQILPHSGKPTLHERGIRTATRYVKLAERHSGSIPAPVGFDYVWGDALDAFNRTSLTLRIVNLETAITTSDAYWQGKGVHYRMHPNNTPCLTAAGIDCCVLANNHVMDWNYNGLEDTLQALDAAGIAAVGAGHTLEEAQRPAVFEGPGESRLLVFAAGSASSGIPTQWAATDDRPGVHLIDEFSARAVTEMTQVIASYRRPDDLVVLSLHWGPNWGYSIPPERRAFAHGLIDEAGVDVVHGHSSHHVQGIEIYRDRPILYGCGDFLTDYEGIGGYEEFHGDLGLMYFATLEAETGALGALEMHPTTIRRFQVSWAAPEAAAFIAALLNREGRRWDTRVEVDDRGVLVLRRD